MSASRLPFTLPELKAWMNDFPYRALENEPLAPYTTLRIGGPCPMMVFPGSEEALVRLTAFFAERKAEWRVLGGGTNLLVSDKGVGFIVINLRDMKAEVQVEGEKAEATASYRMPKLAHAMARNALSGLEFAVGIPGSLGGALYMNAGAFGRETKDVVTAAYVMDAAGNCRWLEWADLEFGYRRSRFQRTHETVLRARLALHRGDADEILKTMHGYQEKRNATQPVASQSAGCIFANPPGESAGRLIDSCGLKGARVGGAVVSGLHANYILSEGATSDEVLALIEKVQRTVKEKAGVELHREMVVW